MSRSRSSGPVPEPLSGGWSSAEVVRIGDNVHRTMSPNAPFVHDLLMHLEWIGFDGSPRYRGVDADGREVLTYLEGTVANGAAPGVWTDDQLRQAAFLLRRYHDATAGSPLAGREEVVCHNDFAPWNTVFVAGLPVAVIDFDDARPGSRLRDLAYVLWCWLAPGTAVVSVAEHARRIRLMGDTYGFDAWSEMIPEIARHQQEILAKQLGYGRMEQVRRIEAEIAWLRANGAELRRRL